MMKALELKIPPVIIVVLVAGLMLLVAPLFPQVQFGPLPHWIALAVAILGMMLPTVAAISFKKACTTVHPNNPNKTSCLVTTGIYRITRNPMYLGFAFMLLGWGLYLGNMAALFGLPVYMFYMNQFQIKPEERILTEKFGQAYQDYRSNANRWL